MPDRAAIHLDPTGFPMVWFDEIGAYVHWLPVTKIQFEHFLCAAPDAYFDGKWYEDVLLLNPRVTPRALNGDSYWRALMTGVLPSEAQRFASWCGDGYRLLSDGEWTVLFQTTQAHSSVDVTRFAMIVGRDPRARVLIERIDDSTDAAVRRIGRARQLAEQMLLRYGAMEWVLLGSPSWTWSLRGEPLPEFCGSLVLPEAPAELLTADPEAVRFPAAGFRLLYRPGDVTGTSKSRSSAHLESANGD